MSRAFALVMKVPVAFLILASCCLSPQTKMLKRARRKRSPARCEKQRSRPRQGRNSLRAEHSPGARGLRTESAEANWRLGKVRASGKWLSLSDAEQQSESDGRRLEYRKQRNEAEGNSKLLRGLARWCLEEWLE